MVLSVYVFKKRLTISSVTEDLPARLYRLYPKQELLLAGFGYSDRCNKLIVFLPVFSMADCTCNIPNIFCFLKPECRR